MNWTTAMSRALDEQSDELYEEAKALVDQIYSGELLLENSQLNSLVSTANASTSITSVAQFVKHQAGRDSRTFDGWRAQFETSDLCRELAGFSEKKALERAKDLIAREELHSGPAPTARELKEIQRELAMEILRRFITAFTVLYRYRYRQEKGNG